MLFHFQFQANVTDDNYEEIVNLALRAVQVTVPDEQNAENIAILSDRLSDTARLVEDGAPVSEMVHIYIVHVNVIIHCILSQLHPRYNYNKR